MDEITFELRGEYITLDALLKVTGSAPSGGVAKMMISQGEVQVDGAVELRKTCKIRVGQVVEVDQNRILVRADAA
jgi:ribosome-associated protein